MLQKYGVIVVSVIALIASSAAIYYRREAVELQCRYRDAMDQLEQRKHSPVESDADALQEVADPSAILRAPPSSRKRDVDDSMAETDVVEPVAGGKMPPSPVPSEQSRRPENWMENLRTNDPQRYAEFQQRREEMQQRRQAAWERSAAYFINRDTSEMSQAEADEYTAMIGMLNQAATLNQQLQSGLSPELRRQLTADLRSNVVAVLPLLEKERNREYYDVAIAMGQSEQEAATMVSYINQIASNTSIRTILPGVRVGGGGRRP